MGAVINFGHTRFVLSMDMRGMVKFVKNMKKVTRHVFWMNMRSLKAWSSLSKNMKKVTNICSCNYLGHVKNK